MQNDQTVDKTITILSIGDKSSNKIKLLNTFIEGKYNNEIPHFVFETTIKRYDYKGKKYGLVLSDMSEMDEFAAMRETTYKCCDVVLLCFNIGDKESYHNIYRKYYPDFYQHQPTIPIFLVGNRSEKRNKNSDSCVSQNEGKQLQEMIKAQSYVECSYKENSNINDIFEQIIELFIQKEQKEIERVAYEKSGKMWFVGLCILSVLCFIISLYSQLNN